MQNTRIYARRIEQFIERLYAARYTDPVQLTARYVYDQDAPIPIADLERLDFKAISIGENWGALWGSAWFKFDGSVPESHAGKEVLALIDVDGEACVFVDGVPERGLTHKKLEEGTHLKRRVPVANPATPGEPVSILIEAGANGLFGADSGPEFTLRQAEIVVFDRETWQLALDLQILADTAKALPIDSPRAQKIMYGLNSIANTWNDGAGLAECKKLSEALIAVPANASDMTAYSIGHAHIDLGWLWPVRETRRKGGRTFSTALRLMEEYPEYVFGASQPQLYAWVKEDYPEVYAQITKAIDDGRWECQGAMWVEPDMNITGGESLVRQCLYGKRYYREEFGKEIRNLWLPDVFGYSAALPQILKKCGVDIFMTQKISWNETNTFPHHTFYWEGIDGTSILTHFLPTNTYNLDNQPVQFIESQKRFAQKDIQNEFLNLYGIGDGGGGPSRLHIERARRLTSTEGVPKVKFAFAQEFFEKIAETAPETLPKWVGELYLELHRGTLTTQGKMKWYNRRLENTLRDVELLGLVATQSDTDIAYPKELLDSVWKDTLLNQFHDILPGSSIGWVYKDAHALSKENLEKLGEAKSRLIGAALGVSAVAKEPATPKAHVLINTLSWDRTEVLDIDGRLVQATIPAMGYTTVSSDTASRPTSNRTVNVDENTLENGVVRVSLAADGTIASIVDISTGREYLEGSANRLLSWEDLPYSWDAWDVSHYYRETTPEQARLVERRVKLADGLRGTIYQKLAVGDSTIEQLIHLDADSTFVRIDNHIEWRETSKLLKVHAETAIHGETASYEIQYGTLKRTTHENTSWDQARFEVAAQRFADLSRTDAGIALVNDSKYGYSAYGSSLELSLLRSPNAPDPDADRGEHDISYGYVPHTGTLESSSVLEIAHALNTPILVVPCDEAPEIPEARWFVLEGENVKIETVKAAERKIDIAGNPVDSGSASGIVIRLYETRGENARIGLTTKFDWDVAYESDMLEENRVRLDANDKIELEFGPYEIKTIVLE